MARTKARAGPLAAQRAGWLARWRDHFRILRDSALRQRAAGHQPAGLAAGGHRAGLPAGLFLLQLNLAAMTGAWEGRPGLSVYFEPARPIRSARGAGRGAAREPRRRWRVGVVSQDEALAEFQPTPISPMRWRCWMTNPLPASCAPPWPRAGRRTWTRWRRWQGPACGVAEVVVEKTWLERVTDITRVVTRLGVMLAVLFGLGAVLITATSVRLAIEARLDELRVLKLVGATDAQMRRPFLYFGAVYGLGGGLVAAMLISICAWW
jgi:cell division transport system permease protein